MTSKKILIALGLAAAFASPSFADTVESDPITSGRQLSTIASPFAHDVANAYAMAHPGTVTHAVPQDWSRERYIIRSQ